MSLERETATPFADASDVNAEAGAVIVDGPDGVAVAFTPDAAEETGRRLIAAATQARDAV